MKKLDKQQKKNVEDFIVYMVAVVLLCGFVVLISNVILDGIVAVNYESRNKVEDSTSTKFKTKEEVISAAKDAIAQKEYCNVMVEIQDNEEYEVDENTYSGHVATYTYRTNKDKSKVSYSYIDQNIDDSSIIEFWAPSDEGYDIYIWSSDVSNYVLTSSEDEPVKVSTWDVMDSIDDYSLEEEEGYWGEQEEPCYILSTYGKNDKYTLIGQYIYISKYTSLPLGILTVGAIYPEDAVTTNEDGSISIDVAKELKDSTEVSDSSSDNHIESIVRLRYSFTSSEFNDIKIPTNYLTEEEYYNAVSNKE